MVALVIDDILPRVFHIPEWLDLVEARDAVFRARGAEEALDKAEAAVKALNSALKPSSPLRDYVDARNALACIHILRGRPEWAALELRHEN